MYHQEILSRLPHQLNRSEVIYTATMQEVLTAIVCRLGEQALTLSVEDLQLAREEVKEAISHNLDIRDYIDMGLDVWEITRTV